MNIKSFILASFLSLSKAERKIIFETLQEDLKETTKEEEKHELKLISEERFYEILDRADEFILNKYKDVLTERSRGRGIQDGYNIEQMFHNKGVLIEDFRPNSAPKSEYPLNTDNDLYELTEYMHVKEYKDDIKIIEFYIPKINVKYLRSKSMNPTEAMFEKNNRIWEYKIVKRLDNVIDGYHQVIRFVGVCVRDGESMIKRTNDLGIRRVLK